MSKKAETETKVEAVESMEVETVKESFKMIYDMPDPKKPGHIKVSAKKDGKAANIYYNFGVDFDTMTELFGKEVVFSQARAQMKIKLQSSMRAFLAAGRSVEDLLTLYIPGVALERTPTDMGTATEKYFSGLTDAEQDIMLANLMKHRENK